MKNKNTNLISMGCGIGHKFCDKCYGTCKHKCKNKNDNQTIDDFQLIAISIVPEEMLIDKNCRIKKIIINNKG